MIAFSVLDEKAVENEVFTLSMEVKKELLSDVDDLLLRQDYFSKKFKGNILSEVFVGYKLNDDRHTVVTIFVQFRKKYIKDEMVFNNRKLIDSVLTSNFEI